MPISCFRSWSLHITHWITLPCYFEGCWLLVSPRSNSWPPIVALPIGLLNISITSYLSCILLIGTAPQGTHFMGTLDSRLQYYPKPPTTTSKRSHLDSLQHSSLLPPTRWVVWDLVPWCTFSKTRGGTWWRMLIGCHHHVCRSMAWQMKDSGPTLSCSPGYNCWNSRTTTSLATDSQFIKDLQRVAQTILTLQGQIDSLASTVLQNWQGWDLLSAERGGLRLFLRGDDATMSAGQV